MGKLISGWFNFKTGEFECHTEAPENLQDYIPQDTPVQDMFAWLVNERGMSPLDAMVEILRITMRNEENTS